MHLANLKQGLPPEWESMLKGAGIDKKEVAENKDAVLDVLEFQSLYQQQQALGMAPTLPSQAPQSQAKGSNAQSDNFTEEDINPDVFDPAEPMPLPSEVPIRLGLFPCHHLVLTVKLTSTIL